MSPKRKIPTKTELLQLQKLYKTDEKIGERLGGVPAYLVAYWRRKKNIPKYSLPKFSETEIRTLWERYGDDEKAGLELGISKAAYYNWRRRYGIREKPAFLKLEQLELNFPGSRFNTHASSLWGKQTIARKILARAAGEEKVEVGQTVAVEPQLAFLGEAIGEVVARFKQAGPEYVWNPGKIAVTLGNFSSDKNQPSDSNRQVREFVKRQGIKSFYDLREGVCHQVVMEKGHILPGNLVLGINRLAGSHGCLSSLAIGINPEQMATVWSKGKIELTVPGTIRIDITGRKSRGVYAKDVIMSIIRELGDNAAGKAIEFGGSVVSQMSVSERFTLASMATDLGAEGVTCPYDATTRRYLTGRTMTSYKPFVPDRNAEYNELYQISVDQLVPQVVAAGQPGVVKAAAEIEGTAIDQILIGTCSSGRFDDLRVAADILKGKQINPDCRVYVYPGSRSVYLEALKKGLIRVFVEAGAMVMNPGNGPFGCQSCSGIEEGEKVLATTTAYQSRLLFGSGAEVYLSSPATAAASALNGVITDPGRFVR